MVYSVDKFCWKNEQTKQTLGGRFLTDTPQCTFGNQKIKERENYWGW